MENYILWSPSFDKKTHETSFFVAPINVQRVAKGTSGMVAEMLADLGVKDAPIKRWSIRHFLTNYMTDEPDAEDWEEVWGDTWEVKVKGLTRTPNFNDGTKLTRSYARDKTWDGDEDSLPSELVIVADFLDEAATTRAADVIEAVEKIVSKSTGSAELAGEIDVPGALLKSIEKAAADRKTRGRKSKLLSMDRRDRRDHPPASDSGRPARSERSGHQF